MTGTVAALAAGASGGQSQPGRRSIDAGREALLTSWTPSLRPPPVVALNPQKPGRLVGWHRAPLIHYHRLQEIRMLTAVVMNPNYLEENACLLVPVGVDVRLVSEPS